MIVEHTYAEAFKSVYAEVLVSAKNRQWLDYALTAATGHASSTILCDCEAGLDHYTQNTPDGRPGAVLQFHVPKFKKNWARALELVLIHRIGQNILTCPTASAWNRIDSPEKFKIGKKLGYFGDGFQKKATRWDRNIWTIPIMGGEFIVESYFGYAEGVMGGNLWFMGENEETALTAAEKAVAAIQDVKGVITPFPGGITWSGSKAGSRYPFLVASTFHTYCPTLRDKLEDSQVPAHVNAIMEIIINGKSPEIVQKAMQTGIQAALNSPGLIKISAGNYGGRLGKYKLWLQ